MIVGSDGTYAARACNPSTETLVEATVRPSVTVSTQRRRERRTRVVGRAGHALGACVGDKVVDKKVGKTFFLSPILCNQVGWHRETS